MVAPSTLLSDASSPDERQLHPPQVGLSYTGLGELTRWQGPLMNGLYRVSMRFPYKPILFRRNSVCALVTYYSPFMGGLVEITKTQHRAKTREAMCLYRYSQSYLAGSKPHLSCLFIFHPLRLFSTPGRTLLHSPRAFGPTA